MKNNLDSSSIGSNLARLTQRTPEPEETPKEFLQVLCRGAGTYLYISAFASFLCLYFVGIIATLFLIIALILAALYNIQDRLLYLPYVPLNSRTQLSTPEEFNLPYQNVYVPTSDKQTLHGFWIPFEDNIVNNVVTFLYLHGNAGNIGHRLQNVVKMRQSFRANILMVDYRGYGKSTGRPTESGLVKDARAAIDYLYTRHDIDHSKIILFGRSLGGAVAINVAADPAYETKLHFVIVENTFTSIRGMMMALDESLMRIPHICYKNKFNSLEKIKKCKVPFLFISGTADTLVPPLMMSKLYMACGSKIKDMLKIEGGTHNETWLSGRSYYDGIRQFMERLAFNSDTNNETNRGEFIIDVEPSDNKTYHQPAQIKIV